MSPEERATFAALADVLVPEADGMPAAWPSGVHERRLDRVLGARPDLAGRCRRPGRRGRAGAEAEIARLRAEDVERVPALVSLVTGAYSHPKVRSLIGYPGQRAPRGLPRPGRARPPRQRPRTRDRPRADLAPASVDSATGRETAGVTVAVHVPGQDVSIAPTASVRGTPSAPPWEARTFGSPQTASRATPCCNSTRQAER